MKKRLFAAMLALVMCLSLFAGCTKPENPTEPTNNTEPSGPVETVIDMKNDVGVTINWQQKITPEVAKMLKDSGVTYVRIVFSYPYMADGITPNAGYMTAKRCAQVCYDAGLKIMAQSIWPGGMAYNATTGQVQWTSNLPEVYEDYDDDYFYKMVKAAYKYVAKDIKDICSTWLVSNEPDISTYTGPMTVDQIVRYIESSAEGIKEGNPAASCGVNMLVEVWEEYSLKIVRQLYDEDSVLDWMGLDGYYGTLQEGGPETWEYYINTFYEAAGVPIVITEYGYSSAEYDPKNTCKFQWEGHGARGPEVQGEYIKACLELFAKHPEVLGSFWYALSDDDPTGVCWECGDPECNLYSSWGLLSHDNTPKPALGGLSEGAEAYQ